MKTFTLTLSEAQMEMLDYALRNTEFREYLQHHPALGWNQQITEYEQEYSELCMTVSILDNGMEEDYGLEHCVNHH